MKLEQQVCSLDLARRLKEMGVKQKSLFYWRLELPAAVEVWTVELGNEELGFHNIYSAFTVAELGEMLPKGTESWQHLCDKDCDPRYRGENIGWYCELADKSHCELENTEGDARAKMLVWLLENKLLEPVLASKGNDASKT